MTDTVSYLLQASQILMVVNLKFFEFYNDLRVKCWVQWSVGQRHEHTVNSLSRRKLSHRKSSTGMEKTKTPSRVFNTMLSFMLVTFLYFLDLVYVFFFISCVVGMISKVPMNKQAIKLLLK